jgi:hypothetical protein
MAAVGCLLIGCANQVSYVRQDHPVYPTEEIFPQTRQEVWAAAKAAMVTYPLVVQDGATGTIETEWLFGESDVTRQLVRQGEEFQSDYVQIRYRIHVAVTPVGIGTRVAIQQEVLENRRYTKGMRSYYAADHFVAADSSTELEHRLLGQIQRQLVSR